MSGLEKLTFKGSPTHLLEFHGAMHRVPVPPVEGAQIVPTNQLQRYQYNVTSILCVGLWGGVKVVLSSKYCGSAFFKPQHSFGSIFLIWKLQQQCRIAVMSRCCDIGDTVFCISKGIHRGKCDGSFFVVSWSAGVVSYSKTRLTRVQKLLCRRQLKNEDTYYITQWHISNRMAKTGAVRTIHVT